MAKTMKRFALLCASLVALLLSLPLHASALEPLVLKIDGLHPPLDHLNVMLNKKIKRKQRIEDSDISPIGLTFGEPAYNTPRIKQRKGMDLAVQQSKKHRDHLLDTLQAKDLKDYTVLFTLSIPLAPPKAHK